MGQNLIMPSLFYPQFLQLLVYFQRNGPNTVVSIDARWPIMVVNTSHDVPLAAAKGALPNMA